MKNSLKLLLLSIPLSVLLAVVFISMEREHRLSFVPEKLSVSNIVYTKEEVFGFGPGGNETGVLVYELPDKIASDIEKIGIEYFVNLTPRQGNNSDLYRKWQKTPITDVNKIEEHLDRYGFGISIDRHIENEIDEAISKPGSFFANGRGGRILIVNPKNRRVFLAYSG
ncbi:hypothetical protein [Chamaesiphon minutus]|uniref:Uncharacterized protein n=1 Tax=Chamaesiphon minutus (strain ATCC 27169 / PCC 6605) TaxID=1173020 RepID=K9UIN9_CHAP6|nr:hypothetical protein [Chamaesiphon minutus]AFY94074.1 hypothetical protein Cha6605_3045 [Chamaesiphon minutus PCC 6605]